MKVGYLFNLHAKSQLYNAIFIITQMKVGHLFYGHPESYLGTYYT